MVCSTRVTFAWDAIIEQNDVTFVVGGVDVSNTRQRERHDNDLETIFVKPELEWQNQNLYKTKIK